MSNKVLNLHNKQSIAFLSPATEILYGGAAGGGKSHLFRVSAISWCYDIPGLQAYFFRRTSPDLWHNHMEGPGSFPAILAPWIESGHVKMNMSKGFFEFWNGSRINLCHCQHLKDIYNYQGAEIHVLFIDELTQWVKAMYVFLRSRVRLGGLIIPDKWKGFFPRVLCGTNPGGIGHNWVKADWIDRAAPLKVWKVPDKEGGLTKQFVPALLEDNPTLTENDPEYEHRLQGMGSEHLVKAMRYGDWDIIAGGAVDDVWERDIHVVQSFKIPNTWRIDRSFDWGSSKPFSVGWWAEANGEETRLANGKTWTPYPGTMFRIGEMYGWNGSPNEGCKMLARDIAKNIIQAEKRMGFSKVYPGPADSSIYDAENGVCIANDMEKEGVRWTKADKSPGSRVSGLEKLRQYLSSSCQKPMESPGLFIFDNCHHFIRTVPVLPRDERKPDDVETNAEDHVYDEVRYRLMHNKPQATSHRFSMV